MKTFEYTAVVWKEKRGLFLNALSWVWQVVGIRLKEP